MPMTVYLVGLETGSSFPERELFTFEGWRMIQSGRWGLRRWNDNNPALNTTVSSKTKSLISWTISRYGYEVRVNGEVEASNVSGNWRPEALFDRLNGDNQWIAGEVLFYPRVMMLSEKQKIEGYLAEKWNLQSGLPSGHPYKSSKPLGQAGLVINGIPEKAGSYSVNVTGTNKWGQASEVFNITVLPMTPRLKLLRQQGGQLLLDYRPIFLT